MAECGCKKHKSKGKGHHRKDREDSKDREYRKNRHHRRENNDRNDNKDREPRKYDYQNEPQKLDDERDMTGVPPPLSSLRPWVPRDYQPGIGIDPDIAFTEKAFFYDSTLATKGMIFHMDRQGACYPEQYYVRNLNTQFTGPNPGIPGGFEYSQGIQCWANDNLYDFGKSKYSSGIGHFGHSHIFTMMTISSLLRVNPKANLESQMLMSQHLINGSTQIFNFFGGLIDVKGNKIPYVPGTPAGDLRGLFDMFINGTGTTNGVMNPEFIVASFQKMKDVFLPNSLRLQEEINVLNNFLKETLNMNGPVEMLAWYYSMKHHQEMIIECFHVHYRLYRTSKSSRRYQRRFNAANENCRIVFNTGPKMAAFFGAFYSAISFLDIMLQELGMSTIQIIPNEFRRRRVTAIHTFQKRYWMEHVSMFIDYQKVAALEVTPETGNQLYRLTVSMNESCESIDIHIGEVFRACDVMTRGVKIFEKLPGKYP